jgi:hypothetical protein
MHVESSYSQTRWRLKIQGLEMESKGRKRRWKQRTRMLLEKWKMDEDRSRKGLSHSFKEVV